MDTNLLTSPSVSPSTSVYRELLADVGAMFDEDLEQAVIDTKTECDTVHARLLVLTHELDRRRVTERSHVLSTTEWLRWRCAMTAREASGTVKTARSLAQMPNIAQEAVTGRIVNSAVKLLARTRDRHPDEFARDEEEFATGATELDPGDLRKEVALWEQEIDFEQARADTEYDARCRELFFNQSYHGRWDMQGTFGVAGGHVIDTALRGFIQRSYIDESDNRSMYERLADAEVGIHQFWLDHNTTVETSGGEKPHITVVVPYDVLTRARRQLPELDGYAIDPSTLRRWVCDAGIVRIVTNADGQPIDVGRRTRTIPPALRRALDLRDNGCTWPGCGIPASWCDAHHVVHWADGGDTNLENTRLLCRRHHTRTHCKDDTQPPEP